MMLAVPELILKQFPILAKDEQKIKSEVKYSAFLTE